MASPLKAEIQEVQKPTILICGNKNPLAIYVCTSFPKSTKVICFENEKKQDHNLMQNNNLRIFSNLHNLLAINEKIDYIIIFLEENKNVFKILEKFEKDDVKILIVTNIRKVKNNYKLIENLVKKENYYFVLLGDLFGETINQQSSKVSKIIQNVKTNKTVDLFGNELCPIFPISLKDTLKGINHVLFGNTKKDKIIYLFYKYPQTIVSSMLLLKRIEPDLEIKYEVSKKEKEYIDFYNLEKEIIHNTNIIPQFPNINFEGFEKSAKEIIESREEKFFIKNQILKIIKERQKKKLFLLFSSFIAAFFIYLVLIFVLFISSLLFLKQSVSSIKNGNFATASQQSLLSTKILSFIDYPITSTIALIPYKENKFMYDYNFIKKTSSLIYVSTNTIKEIKDKGSKGDFSNIEENIKDIRYAYFEIQKIRTQNKTLDEIFLKLTEKYNLDMITIIELIPEIFATTGEKNYLVLFQNNAELRPGGGFIGSLAELKFSKGKIKEFIIRDVYELDGQLKIHLEPHYIIRKNLQQHLYLRDSNFSLDFEESASKGALIYNLETGKKVNGVVAINYEVLKRIIEKIGNLHLYEYKTTLNEKNAFDFIHNTIESNFFPGSTQKKQILNSIFDQISLELSENQSKLLNVISIFPDLLEEKHIQFAFNDEHIQKIFRLTKLVSSIKDTREKKEYILYDTLGINEANIGINKANINVTRDVEYKIYLEKNKIKSKVILNLYSQKNNTDYKSYVRIITPLKSVLSKIKIDGKEQNIIPAITDFKVYENKNFKKPKGLEVSSENIDNYQIFGFVTTVAVQENQIIEIEYINGLKPDYLNYFGYNLLYFKQPGTESYPLKISIYSPLEYKFKANNQYSIKNNLITIKTTASKDKELIAEFVKIK